MTISLPLIPEILIPAPPPKKQEEKKRKGKRKKTQKWEEMSVYWSGLIQEGVTTQILDEIERESEQRRSHSLREREKEKKIDPYVLKNEKIPKLFRCVPAPLSWPHPHAMTQNDPALIIEPKAGLVWHRWYKRFLWACPRFRHRPLICNVREGRRDREYCLPVFSSLSFLLSWPSSSSFPLPVLLLLVLLLILIIIIDMNILINAICYYNLILAFIIIFESNIRNYEELYE